MISNSDSYVVVLGTTLMDIIGFTFKDYKLNDSNPGKVKISFGGVCTSIAENMARLGINTKYISILGDDEAGRSLLEHSSNIGYDMKDSLIIKNGRTPTYMAILDQNGEMVSAVADTEAISFLDESFVDSKENLIKNASYTFLDADNPRIMKYILEKFKFNTNFILDPCSSTKAAGIKDLIKHFHTIKPNRIEAEVLCGFSINSDEDLHKASEYFLSLGIKNVFISLDAEGIYYNNGIEKGKLKITNPKVVNVTGAGDSFVAGLGYCYTNNLSLVDTVKFSMAMSNITISACDTVNPSMSFERVSEELENIKWYKTSF